jgi:hypothetical protein
MYTVGVSRLGNHNATRHCASSAPFNASLFPWEAGARADDYFYVVFRNVSMDIKLNYQREQSLTICEE